MKILKKTLIYFFLIVGVNAAALDAKPAPDSFANLAERLLPAVVNVSTTQTVETRGSNNMPPFPFPFPFPLPPDSPFNDFFKGYPERQQPGPPPAPQKRPFSLGSGFVIDPAGFIITNNHVIGKATEIKVKLQDGTELEAKIVGRDAKIDIALLKVETEKSLPFVKFADSDRARIGDWVMAIGNPFGLGGSVSVGIVSARGRDIKSGPYDDYIQTDAAINKGHSGGPLFNMEGEVVGINTAIYSPTGGSVGIGFSIPSNLAFPIVDQLKQFGETRRGWLGVRIQNVDPDLAESLGLKSITGALIASVNLGEPAAMAGLKEGDVILKYDGVDIKDSKTLMRIVAETPVDKSIKIVAWRDKKEQVFEVRVGRLEAYDGTGEKSAKQPKFPSQAQGQIVIKEVGLTIATINDQVRRNFRLGKEITSGVIILEVDPDGPAATRGIRPGDIIIQVNQNDIFNPEGVKAQIDSIIRDKQKIALFLIERNGNRRFAGIPVQTK